MTAEIAAVQVQETGWSNYPAPTALMGDLNFDVEGLAAMMLTRSWVSAKRSRS